VEWVAAHSTAAAEWFAGVNVAGFFNSFSWQPRLEAAQELRRLPQ
jgi:hypothetical protein